MEYIEMYGIRKDDLEKLEEIVSYLHYHNKNLNAAQYGFIEELEEIIEKVGNRFTGYDRK